MPSWKICDRLHVGSVPPAGDGASRGSVHVLVFCAMELQLPAEAYPGVEVVYCPLDDDGDTPIASTTWELLFATARHLAELHRRGLRLLITCHLGINRSALVAALTFREIERCSGTTALLRVQLHRPGSLRNPRFVEALQALSRPARAEARTP